MAAKTISQRVLEIMFSDMSFQYDVQSPPLTLKQLTLRPGTTVNTLAMSVFTKAAICNTNNTTRSGILSRKELPGIRAPSEPLGGRWINRYETQ